MHRTLLRLKARSLGPLIHRGRALQIHRGRALQIHRGRALQIHRGRALQILGLALLLTLPAWSAPPRPVRDPRTERVIEALLIWRLVDEVRLSDQQIARVFPRIKALKDLRIELGLRRVTLQRELRLLLAEQPRNDDLIQAKIAELDALRARIERERERLLQEIRDALTVEQRARFAIIEDTFEAETLRTLEEVRRTVEEQRRRR